MSELTVEVVHVVAPDELDEYDLDPALRERADGRYLLVGRKGGRRRWASGCGRSSAGPPSRP
ncbi:DUF7526 family protein [Halosegnis marinus]|uniref:DUF7526 family protein n=1 Tax=Halosegnis marinus TaxID=3034023 RepID=UPI00361E2DDA